MVVTRISLFIIIVLVCLVGIFVTKEYWTKKNDVVSVSDRMAVDVSEQNEMDQNLIFGTWKASYEQDTVGLTFFSDSVLFNYQDNVRMYPYFIFNDTMVIQNDTGRISKLDRDALSIRPLKELEEDVNIIFLLDFNRVR